MPADTEPELPGTPVSEPSSSDATPERRSADDRHVPGADVETTEITATEPFEFWRENPYAYPTEAVDAALEFHASRPGPVLSPGRIVDRVSPQGPSHEIFSLSWPNVGKIGTVPNVLTTNVYADHATGAVAAEFCVGPELVAGLGVTPISGSTAQGAVPSADLSVRISGSLVLPGGGIPGDGAIPTISSAIDAPMTTFMSLSSPDLSRSYGLTLGTASVSAQVCLRFPVPNLKSILR